MSEVLLRRGESIDYALRQLKEKLEWEGTMDEVRRLQAFENPAQRKRRKSRLLAQKNMRARKSRTR